MPRKRRNDPATACAGKVPHSQTKAMAHLHALRAKDGAFGMNAYRCPHCKHWHVGHRPRNRGGKR